MRKIKFRGKRIDNGKWVFGWYFFDDTGGFEAHYIKDERTLLNEEVEAKTVGQLVSYYSVDFFDGDLLSISCDCDSEYGCSHGDDVYLVGWNKPAGYVLKKICSGRSYPLDEFGEENMRVIGNVYDNPELLPQ